MGILARVLGIFNRSDNSRFVPQVKTTAGADVNRDCPRFGPAGDDSAPCEGDYGALLSIDHTSGSAAIVGTIDVKNQPKAAAGEKRLYARTADGAQVCEIWLKQDGSISVSNGSGALELQANGSILLNGVEIDPDGNLTATSVKTAAGIDLDTHTHGGVTTGSGNTGPAQ